MGYQVEYLTGTFDRLYGGLARNWLSCVDEGSRESVDSTCKSLTASWVRERHVSNADVEVCDFYETLETTGAEAVLEAGVYTLQVSSQILTLLFAFLSWNWNILASNHLLHVPFFYLIQRKRNSYKTESVSCILIKWRKIC